MNPARGALAAAALVAVLSTRVASAADGFSASVEPSYSHVETDITDQAGETHHEDLDLFTQRYRLSLDRTLTETLTASVGGALLDDRGWKRSDGVSSDEHGRATSLFGRLTLGTPVLSAGLGVDRNEYRARTATTPALITETYTAYASWRPLQLPQLDLRLSRVNLYDRSHSVRDTTTDSAAFTARYDAEKWDARYLLAWTRADEQLQRSQTTSIDQMVLGTRTDRLFGGRTNTYLSANVQGRNTSVETRAAGATVTRAQLPIGGLSAIEALPATPELVVLAPNPLLVDGNVGSTASVNVGYGPSALGDRDLRDVGARFGDEVTEVNQIYVWLDQPLAPVGQALANTVQVLQSRDNEHWTVVTPSLAVPSPFESRLEITIPQTAARFLKVVLRPLDVGVTTDPAYRDLNVTEVQFFLVLPATSVPRHQSTTAVAASGFARTLILRSPELAHDLSVSVARNSDLDRTRYSVINGLSLTRRLWRDITGNARGSRLDEDSGRGHEGVWQWSAAATGRPLPTAYWTLTYSGSRRDSGGGADLDDDGIGDEPILTHALSALGRADWYDGISSQLSAGAAFTRSGLTHGSSGQAAGTTSLTPNRWATLTVGGLVSRAVAYTPETGDIVTQFARLDASLSLTPAPALSGTGTISRLLLTERPTTLGTLQLNWFPLRGELQLAVVYSSTLDTAAEQTTRIFTPSLRWNVRSGVALTSSYSWLESDAPAQVLSSRAFMTTLLITL